MPDKEIYSTRLRAGRKTYFVDVKEGESGEAYLKLTESCKTGEAFEQSRIVVDAEHAEALLEAMADAVRRLMAQAQKKKVAPKGTDKANTLDKVRKEHPQAYAPWSKEDDEQLEQWQCEGMTQKAIAERMGRQRGAISSRVRKLELKEKYGYQTSIIIQPLPLLWRGKKGEGERARMNYDRGLLNHAHLPQLRLSF